MRKLFRSILKRFKGVSKYNRYDSVNPALMTKRDLSSMCGELYVAKQWGKDYCKVVCKGFFFPVKVSVSMLQDYRDAVSLFYIK